MDMNAEFAKQTAAAQTTVANGGTPQAVVTTGTVITAQPGTLPSATPTVGAPSTPTNAVPTTPAASTPSGPTTTPVPAGVRPATYTLQNGADKTATGKFHA